MGIKMQSVFSFFKFILVFILLTACLYGCKNDVQKNDRQFSLTKSDSLDKWIAFGRNHTNSKALRKENLVKAYQSAKLSREDSTKVKYLLKIQWSFLGLQDSVWFRKTNKEANVFAEKVRDSLRLAGSYWDLAVFLDQNQVNDSAYYNFFEAQKIFYALDDKSRVGRLTYEMARIQSKVKDYTGSEINVIKAIELLKPLNENLMLYNCYNLLGIVAKDLKEYDRSLEYYAIAKDYLEKSGVSGSLARELGNNIGVNHLEKGEYSKAASYFESALNQDSLRLKDPEAYARTLNNLAESNYKFNSDSDAEEMFLRSLKIRESIEDLSGLAGGYFDLAKYYLYNKDSIKAIESAKKSNIFAEQSSNNERLLQ